MEKQQHRISWDDPKEKCLVKQLYVRHYHCSKEIGKKSASQAQKLELVLADLHKYPDIFTKDDLESLTTTGIRKHYQDLSKRVRLQHKNLLNAVVDDEDEVTKLIIEMEVNLEAVKATKAEEKQTKEIDQQMLNDTGGAILKISGNDAIKASSSTAVKLSNKPTVPSILTTAGKKPSSQTNNTAQDDRCLDVEVIDFTPPTVSSSSKPKSSTSSSSSKAAIKLFDDNDNDTMKAVVQSIEKAGEIELLEKKKSIEATSYLETRIHYMEKKNNILKRKLSEYYYENKELKKLVGVDFDEKGELGELTDLLIDS